ncbi:Epimerase family protein SDR39U1 [Bagarius yarrelli]|uniref:Epimerase family protein SDR39U1 n=1 Tax=Bagarius yarrelli TaxID=175774 RepID=A0A556TZQ4_BAGYA|nr:Epimerase family protein SDR39U1 [Bagarius yarrelli]
MRVSFTQIRVIINQRHVSVTQEVFVVQVFVVKVFVVKVFVVKVFVVRVFVFQMFEVLVFKVRVFVVHVFEVWMFVDYVLVVQMFVFQVFVVQVFVDLFFMDLVFMVRVFVVKYKAVINWKSDCNKLSMKDQQMNTTTSPATPDGPISVSFIIGAFILAIVFLLGVPGNLFIIWSILSRAHKRSVTTLIILNLACADGAIMCLTVFFIVYLAKQSWVFGPFMCKLLFYLCNTNMYASIMLITLMSVHRLLSVMRPQSAHFFTRKRNVLSVLTLLWLLVFLLAIPALIFRDEKTAQNNHTLCLHTHPGPKYEAFHMSMETVMGFLLPYGIIVSSYMCILRRLRQTPFKRRVRSENLILAIIITFAAFWLPYHIINVLQVVSACTPKDSKLHQTLVSISSTCRAATSSLAFISSCANPVLYVLAGRSYIRTDGMSFMARLFEGTALDIISGTLRVNRKVSRAEAAVFMLKNTDSFANKAERGGSGFIGSELTKLLKVKGHEVTVISRQPGLGRVTWTQLESAGLPDCDAVVNLAGENILNPLKRTAVFTSRISTTRTLTRSITSTKTPPQAWILISGIGVVLGRGGGAIKQMLTPFWLGLGGTLGSGNQPFPWIHVSDLAGIIAHSLDPTQGPASSQPQVFNGVAPALNTNREFTQELGRLLKRPTLLPVPEPLLRAALGPERATILTQGQKVVPKRTLESGYQFRYPDLTSALKEILTP